MKEKELKEKIIASLKAQEFIINPHVRPAICNKQAYKDVQHRSRLEQIVAHREFLQRYRDKAQQYCRNGNDIRPDHKLYVIPCKTATEADLLSEILNSRVIRYLVRSFSISTSITGSVFRYIGIPDLSKFKPEQDQELTIAKALGITQDAYRKLDTIARTEM